MTGRRYICKPMTKEKTEKNKRRVPSIGQENRCMNRAEKKLLKEEIGEQREY